MHVRLQSSGCRFPCCVVSMLSLHFAGDVFPVLCRIPCVCVSWQDSNATIFEMWNAVCLLPPDPRCCSVYLSLVIHVTAMLQPVWDMSTRRHPNGGDAQGHSISYNSLAGTHRRSISAFLCLCCVLCVLSVRSLSYNTTSHHRRTEINSF